MCRLKCILPTYLPLLPCLCDQVWVWQCCSLRRREKERTLLPETAIHNSVHVRESMKLKLDCLTAAAAANRRWLWLFVHEPRLCLVLCSAWLCLSAVQFCQYWGLKAVFAVTPLWASLQLYSVVNVCRCCTAVFSVTPLKAVQASQTLLSNNFCRWLWQWICIRYRLKRKSAAAAAQHKLSAPSGEWQLSTNRQS